MTVGTRSLLYGYHQVLLHPLMVALAWWKLYGFPWDPRLWCAFFLHDIGYWGKPNMDGPEGDLHPATGARLMSMLCDRRADGYWYRFTACHSESFARLLGWPPSRLCAADKIAITLYPEWLWLALTRLSGELWEYLDRSRAGGKYANRYGDDVRPDGDLRSWMRRSRALIRERWGGVA